MHLVFLTPSPAPPGGGSLFNAGLVPALRALGHTVDLRHDASALPDGARPVVDGLLLPDLAPAIEALAGGIAIVHHVAARAGRVAADRAAVIDAERALLPRFAHVIATSAPVAERLAAEYGLVRPPILVPGVPDRPRSPGSGGPGVRMLSVGVLTPRKGHDRLLHALAGLTDLDWSLTIAGDTRRDPVHAAAVAALIETLGLQGRVSVLADPDDAALEAEWARADLFALASSWEGHPAGFVEALRRGIPVVGTPVDGVGNLVPMSAGVLCARDDGVTLAKCLRRALFDHGLRASLAEGAWQAGLAMPGWPQQALAFLQLIEG